MGLFFSYIYCLQYGTLGCDKHRGENIKEMGGSEVVVVGIVGMREAYGFQMVV